MLLILLHEITLLIIVAYSLMTDPTLFCQKRLVL